MNNCLGCGHPKIRHIQDGLRIDCIVCVHLLREDATFNRPVCHVKFNFKLSESEREQAAAANKESFDRHIKCAVCLGEWQEHMGYLCPSGDSTFMPLLESNLPYIHNA